MIKVVSPFTNGDFDRFKQDLDKFRKLVSTHKRVVLFSTFNCVKTHPNLERMVHGEKVASFLQKHKIHVYVADIVDSPMLSTAERVFVAPGFKAFLSGKPIPHNHESYDSNKPKYWTEAQKPYENSTQFIETLREWYKLEE